METPKQPQNFDERWEWFQIMRKAWDEAIRQKKG